MHSPSLYANESIFINLLTVAKGSSINYYSMYADDTANVNVVDVNLVTDEIELVKGRMPENDYEIIVNESNSSIMKLNKEIDDKINDTKLKVVGYYKSPYEINDYFSNLNTVKYNLLASSSDISLVSNNKLETMNYFEENNVNIEDSYEKAKKEYKKSIKESIVASLVVAGIIIAISLVEIYLMMRSSFLSRVKEVGILRAIGVKKKDIYKMFLGEILAITVVTGIIGISLMSYVLKGLTNVSYFADSIMFNYKIVGIASALFLIFNIIVGLMPVHHTIRKTPAKILSSNNVD